MSIGTAIRFVLGRLRAFPKAKGANVAMIFGLALVPLMLAAGAGLDISRALVVRARLAEALDAAGLAVGATNGLSQTEMETLAQKYFNANYTADASFGTPAPLTVVPVGQQISLSTTVPVPTAVMRIVGIDQMNVGATSQVTWGQTKLWVALVLDNTGSMCEPGSQPCPIPASNSKMAALKTATHNLLGMLQNAATNPGDVKVSIVPFSKDVNMGTSNVGAAWVDWTDWEAPPPSSEPGSDVGPGSSCPYGTSTSPYGYRCTTGAANGSSSTNTVPASGLICPGVDNGRYNGGRGGHYYNGCWSSTPTNTNTKTCTKVGNNSQTCNTVTDNTVGYTGSTDPVSTTSCTGSGKSKTCTTTTVTKWASKFSHAWVVNDHSTWTGCIMDRNQDYDTLNTAPTTTDTKFPAENSQYCPPGTITALGYDWATMSSQVDAMTANGNTNQTVGLAWGWQTLSDADPFNPGAVPDDTRRVVILLTDGENTQNRWSNTASVIDARTAAACTNIKNDHITLYSVQVDTSTNPQQSSMLQSCASDSSKYFMLTNADEIVTTFNQIGTQITDLRVSL